MMAYRHHNTLTAVKIGLEVLYILAIIGCIILIVTCSLGLTQKDPNINKDNGLVGIIKEIIWIVSTLLVFQIIAIILNLTSGEVVSAVWGILCAILTAIYLYLITQKQKEGLEDSPTDKS
ncbi:unnamed protein product [Oppiella nova]|uniref:Uncharacterized protein n=1 Tax=Oppiella nova TaxID=334625 RepID=A0A7R9QW96_9ACAR|nr:unnamed protein product [Oppiella nova]CAG2177927.1 unnamed protein product [Oppiella nova]